MDVAEGRSLEDADAAAHDGARSAHGALEAGDRRRGAVAPREADARARVEVVRRAIVALAEQALELGVERRRGGEAIRVEPHAVLDLQVVRAAIRVAERERAGDLARALDARLQRARVRRRPVGGEVVEREIRERAVGVGGLILIVALAPQLAAQLEPVLVVPAEPGELVDRLGDESAAARAEEAVAADAERAHAARAIGEQGVHEHAAVGEREVRAAVAPIPVQVERGLAEHDVLHVRRVARLRSRVPARAVAAVCRQLGDEVARGRLAIPVAVEREVHRRARSWSSAA